MNLGLGIFDMSRDLAAFAARRQEVIAQNIANADTPGYRAVDLAGFEEFYRSDEIALRSSRFGHFGHGEAADSSAVVELQSNNSEKPNRNNVSIEDQMVTGIEIRHQHDLALGIYKTARDIYRLAIGRGR